VRLAFVHDWLTGMRGGEKALEVLCERFPSAALFTLVHVPGSVSPAIERLRPRTSFVQRLPRVAAYYRQYLPLYPAAIEQVDLDPFDVVVSVSHCVAKSVVRSGRARHICYCLTPVRYAWDQFDAYFGPDRIGTIGSRVMRPAMAGLARWDRATASRVDRYVAISHYVAGRIARYYNREATVVYPPVDTDFFRPFGAGPDRSALVVSALVPYKRIEIAIRACALMRLPLTIVGDGPDRPRLERVAGPDVTFTGRVSDEDVRALYQRSAVVLLPGEEDFGIAPLEAQACGRPVVALGRGGATETVLDGTTGVLVDETTPQGFADGIARALASSFDARDIRAHAERFGRARFGDEMETMIRTIGAAGKFSADAPARVDGA
jgi:glycosyltransferase involved in cell wall biosynthesis